MDDIIIIVHCINTIITKIIFISSGITISKIRIRQIIFYLHLLINQIHICIELWGVLGKLANKNTIL